MFAASERIPRARPRRTRGLRGRLEGVGRPCRHSAAGARPACRPEPRPRRGWAFRLRHQEHHARRRCRCRRRTPPAWRRRSSRRAARTPARRPWSSPTGATGASPCPPPSWRVGRCALPLLLTDGERMPAATSSRRWPRWRRPVPARWAARKRSRSAPAVTARPQGLCGAGRGLRRAGAARSTGRDEGGRQARQGGRRRARRPAGLRDARGGLGREVRRPGAVGAAQRRSRRDARGDHRARAAGDLRARAGRGRVSEPCSPSSTELGTAQRVAGADPVANAIAFARFYDASSLARGRPGPRPRVRVQPPAARRGRGRAAVVQSGTYGRCCCSCRDARRCPRRCRTSCSTSSPATTRTPSAASTTTAG